MRRVGFLISSRCPYPCPFAYLIAYLFAFPLLFRIPFARHRRTAPVLLSQPQPLPLPV